MNASSPNNKENSKKEDEDFNNFVYDIALGENGGGVALDRQSEDGMGTNEITIASLMSAPQLATQKGNRKRAKQQKT